MTQQRKKCGKGGFTLVELVVTLVILQQGEEGRRAESVV